MSLAETAAALDRLPWLPDEPDAQQADHHARLARAGGAAVVAGAALLWGAREIAERPIAQTNGAATTVRLPEPRPAPVAEIRQPPQSHRPSATANVIAEIGAFGSAVQAERASKTVARAYPPLAKLPVRAIVARNSKGRRFYRFQVTASDDTVRQFCGRMNQMALSCSVRALPR
jgi:hypothetical protein